MVTIGEKIAGVIQAHLLILHWLDRMEQYSDKNGQVNTLSKKLQKENLRLPFNSAEESPQQS